MSVFQQGLTGLNASQRNLEVISNNISNANAAGFKASFARFSEIYNSAAQVSTGSGTQVADINRQFTQGNVLSTNNPLDFAINGEGFFKVQSDKGNVIYTRNGQFGLDKDGFVVNSLNERLQVLELNKDTGKFSEKVTDLRIVKDAISPKPTTDFNTKVNLDKRAVTINSATTPFSQDNPNSYTSSLTQTIFTDLGEQRLAQVYFAKTGESQWNVHANISGQAANQSISLGQINFDPTSGLPTTQDLQFEVTAQQMAGLGVGFSKALEFDFSGVTQFASNFNIFNLGQNGYDSAAFKNFIVDGDGQLTLNYANGQNQVLARIPLFKFNNPDGLQPIGGSGFLATLEAGSEVISSVGDAAFGTIRAGAIEEANVDLTSELVAMITAQRIYQANSQSIKTQDALLQTVTNLR